MMWLRVIGLLVVLGTISACNGGGSPQQNSQGTAGQSGGNLNNNPPPTAASAKLFIADEARPEGAASETTTLTFTVTLARNAVNDTVTVDYQTVNDSANDADYSATAGQLVFGPNVTEQTITVDITGDDNDEGQESFQLVLNTPVNASLANPAATGTIANDDAACTPRDPTNAANPWLARRIINFSHRGGALEYPENTMYSYLQSVAINAEVLEMDIFETADGELVVIHDATVDRTTESQGDVSSYTLAELQAMDAAFWFIPGRGAVMDGAEEDYVFRGIATGQKPPPEGFSASDFRIPTLEEILQRFPNSLINIELKPDPDSTGSYELKLATLVLEYGRQDDILVASFIDAPATNFKAAAPCVTTSFPTAQAASYVALGQGPSQMPGVSTHQAFQVPPSLGVEVVNQDFVDDAHNANLAVHVFTINDCPEMVRLLNLDVDAIMTDRPNLLEALLAQPVGQWDCDAL